MPRVVVVEDDPGIRRGLIGGLAERGYAVTTFPTGLPVLELVVKDRPDVIILDLGLPDVDARQLLAMIRAVSDVPVIVVTADDDDQSIVATLDRSGRPNKPVSSWQPAAVRGYRGRPTLLSNGETYAQLALLVLHGVGAYLAHGTPDEPGTTLLTVHDDLGRRVVEAGFGTKWEAALAPDAVDRPVLLGGYHGTWADAGQLRDLTVSRSGLAEVGLTLGAGVVLVPDGCPLDFATSITSYLAAESAGRCGPCFNGLPALARALERVASGLAGIAETEQLCALVERRGACAHPDGTARMVRSVLARFPDEVARHARGGCSYRPDRNVRSA